MPRQSSRQKQALEQIAEQAGAHRQQVRGTAEDLTQRVIQAADRSANPLLRRDLESLRHQCEKHLLGQNATGWVNPFPADNPKSQLLQYQLEYWHDPARFKAWLASRQVGKDFSSEGEAAEDCITHPAHRWMIAAPSERQSLDSLDQQKLWAEAFGLIVDDYQEHRDSSQALLKAAEIRYHNKSTTVAVPGRPDTVRGKSASILLTEFDFFEQPQLTWRGLLPSITNPLRGGEKKLRVVSTPNGRGRMMDKIFDESSGGIPAPSHQSNAPHTSAGLAWSRHLTNIYHAVLMGLSVDIPQIRAAMDDDTGWAQEFECQFLDTQHHLLPYEVIQLAESIDATESWDPTAHAGSAHPVYLGIDFGRTNDPTVCWTLQRIGDILWTREVLVLRDMSTPDQERLLSQRIATATRVAFDYTGPGIGLGDYLVQRHKEWHPAAHKMGKIDLCTFTVDFKRALFPRLRRSFEAPTRLRIPISRDIREDLHQMQQIITNGHYNYASPRTREGHSDRCTALALALHAAHETPGLNFAWSPLSLATATTMVDSPSTSRAKQAVGL
ncbi:hypothetical protein [Brevifollis gellanilyticus]|uniref:Terminase large subunit gp17-like C-terminal domain-containing protein n=1 Tax=Brevifollis gellanilyticus TaxID=748831 RepID=A0A512MI62_9BACT|nr:hypothetical protein [Brevifollis gellanilyticus]GEP46422.1 hypothetical protein BGE01nite_57130 [Brevifollis gellanilyticus]